MPKPLVLSSPRFNDGDLIPIAFTGEGEDIAPPLRWENPPAGTKSLALIVEDPDAPDPQRPQRVFCHQVLYNIPPGARELPEGAQLDTMPPGIRVGLNDFGHQAYGGPMPPVGRHRYYFKLYALDLVLPNLGRPTRRDLLKAMEGHILGQAELIGLYEKVHHRAAEAVPGASA
ncbi:YbhB/YbcL family Raf kinase inhibitor-like protein [Myxococcus sp. MISCRS1]|uniref:YbhB/YbcL family Raf kinase inhibitor-like protein n=1 Tax=Myxococcus TaxID=32 RepID=UPI001CBDBF17|nr:MULTISPECIES: YbhB/YbcL family Raf kinase inhibitor-like protein [unclassified Myxococcus]MBZ4395452.1 YbhB/YbcL family Raf kinase inhibitor-like protein [Myxococcus sp. AS-1-15]MBZ4411913.1 YbhB/YbcL family Raf kinase inhibitor-like protein [Myxococcus sp. XM-1-1-1]MCY0999195.1 YbhB/YbcL family Raf kinase inhibitor-like protein [Myxococcus sp. MISCRS1]BDT30801.1 YbhB/YbcL family Raf kinase inhibitor-like protein [Myxococcus sp. MH1]